MALLTKTLERLENLIKDGSFYEAQQMYKTTYHRQRAKKQSLLSYEVLESGAVAQFKAKQVTCGVELGLLLVEAFKEDKEKSTNEESLRRLSGLIESFPEMTLTDSTIEEFSRLVKTIINWVYKSVGVAESSAAATAARRLHSAFGRYVWTNGRDAPSGLATSIVHLTRGDSPETFAEVIVSSAALGPRRERALWLTRATLQSLAIASRRASYRQLAHTRDFFAAAKKGMQEYDGSEVMDKTDAATSAALVNFSEALLLGLRKNSRELVDLLSSRYAPLLAVDPALPALLARVRRIFFQTRGGSGGGLAGLLGGLLGGLGGFGDEDSDDEEDEGESDADDDDEKMHDAVDANAVDSKK